MPNTDERTAADRQLLIDAGQRGRIATLGAYAKLSGPGWLQSALTLGGGSLGSSLYLGILGGTTLLWLQPFAMILGVIMMSAISYVALSTGRRPFRAINEHFNPVLGWSWLAATLIANMVWSLPQYSLCFAVCEQNFFPGLFTGDGPLAPGEAGSDLGKWVVSLAVLALCTLVTWSYGSGSWGVKLYDLMLKLVVALIVASFVGVVVRMSFISPGIDWAAVLRGFLPDPKQLSEPAASFGPLLETIADPAARSYWSDLIVSQQRDVMLSAGAAAVGINMTFLLPYALLSRGWDITFRGLTIFDLCTGTFIPFVLATCCIVIASAVQFHAQLPTGFEVSGLGAQPPEHFAAEFDKMVDARGEALGPGAAAVSVAEQKLAGVLVRRDTFDLAQSLESLFADENGEGGGFFANVIFGAGVVGMTLSSISLMMLISGFVVCEVLDRPPTGWVFRLGCMVSATGVLWPLVWSGGAKAYLTIVAGVFGSMLIPIAYVTFLVIMNQKSLLQDELPAGWKRVAWNVLMTIAAVAASAAGVSAVMKRMGNAGLVVVGCYLALVIAVQLSKERRPESA
ncbi:MAG: hypothetical protein AAGA92_04875 [Planctomycetota bacterium]